MKLAVFCGSALGNDPAFAEAAKELGRWIGESGNTLVYGGGDTGLMGLVAKEVFEAGQKVIGVLPGNVDFIMSREQPYVTDLVVEKDMSERKRRMFALADAFIALPGGIGTLDEISEAITLTKIGTFDKKCVLFNRKGYYEPLRRMFLDMDAAGLWGNEGHDFVLFSDDTEEIEAYLK